MKSVLQELPDGYTDIKGMDMGFEEKRVVLQDRWQEKVYCNYSMYYR